MVSLKGVLQGFMMNGVVGIVCPDLQNSLFDVFREVDPPNSRVCTRQTHQCSPYISYNSSNLMSGENPVL